MVSKPCHVFRNAFTMACSFTYKNKLEHVARTERGSVPSRIQIRIIMTTKSKLVFYKVSTDIEIHTFLPRYSIQTLAEHDYIAFQNGPSQRKEADTVWRIVGQLISYRVFY